MKWDTKDINSWTAEKHPIAATIFEAGNAKEYKTGSWRSYRPVRDAEKCTQCLICYMYCPDSSIPVENDEITQFDLDHCKGCGICAEECPVDAIDMAEEGSFGEKGEG
jgi:pyruvate ferredoxin oxidoreductase delta subunit